MLVLSRKVNEEIVIGSNVTIKVVKVIGNKVRLGISAPNSVNIRRGEVEAPMVQMFDLPLDQLDLVQATVC
jgi:carbon storage regulator CsrA